MKFSEKSKKPLLWCFAVTGLILAHLVEAGISHPTQSMSDPDQKFQLALWGDLPYAKNGDGGKTGAKLNRLVQDMNTANLAFTIFDGDTKDGSSRCDDAAIGQETIDLFNSIKSPTVYVLGDNEWTDCHRTNNGGYNALERLNYLRQSTYGTKESFGQNKMEMDHQGLPGQPYSENTRWTKNGVVFVGLNVPGSNNNKVNTGSCLSAKSARTEADCAANNAEYLERNAKNLAWLAEAFQMARDQKLAGVMVVIQADPGFDWPETEGVNERETLPEIDGYTDLLDKLVSETKVYKGQVVLVHGDTHFFKIDKPLIDPTHLVKNFTRVETFGSPNVHWIKVAVDRYSRNVFTFEPMLVEGND